MSAAYIAEKLVNQQFNVFEQICFDDFVTKYPEVFIFVSGILGQKATVLFTQIGEKLKEKGDWDWNKHCREEAATFFTQSLAKVDMLNKWQLLFVTLYLFQGKYLLTTIVVFIMNGFLVF